MNFYNTEILKFYQKKTLDLILTDFFNTVNKENKERKFIISPTGSGKTFMMYAFIEKIINDDHDDKFLFLLVTHSLQMAKGFKETIKKLGTSIYTFEDLENKVSRLNDKVVLFNPEKVSTDNGREHLIKWKNANIDKNIILIMDEADITHDGKRNKEFINIIKPAYELGFTATFNSKKDIINAKLAGRLPSVIIHEVPLIDVKNAEVIVKGFESIVDTQGVSINSIIKAALEKQVDIYNKTKYFDDYYIPRILIQTNAYKALDIKTIVLDEVSKMNEELYKLKNFIVTGVITADIKEFSENQKSNYLVIIGDNIISRGWDYPEIKIIVTEKNSINSSVGSQLLGRASRMPDHYYRQNDLLNNGYIYVAGKHSIEKSGEIYSHGIIVDKNLNLFDTIEKEEIAIKNFKQPAFKTWINDFDNDYIEKNEKDYEFLIDYLLTIMINIIEDAKEKITHRKEVKRFNFENEAESIGLIDLEIDPNYALESIKKFLYRKLPKILVQDVFSEKKLRDGIEYKNIYESIIQALENDENKYITKLMYKIRYKSISFNFNKRTIDIKKSVKYSHSLYDSDDSMNDEEKDFAGLILNEYCKNNNKYWIRNREKIDIRLPLGYYPDFIVFDENEYFMIEYKGNHLKDNADSLRKKDYGLNNENVIVIMVIKEKDGFKVGTSNYEFSDFTDQKINSIIKLSK
jgi:hypothetical protein